jgi:L-ribulose-5-phosphate 3-epimerase
MRKNSSMPFRLGIRAHDLGRFPAEELARRVRAAGMDCVQLALGKAVEGVELQVGTLHPEMAAKIKAAFDRCHVRIEVLGCYINPIHPDVAARTILLNLFKEHLRYARDFGCNIVALESGSLNADPSFHTGNGSEEVYLDLLDSVGGLVEEAERWGVVVGIEAVSSHVLSTPERMRRLLDDIPSFHLQVVCDPVNLLSFANCHEQRGIMQRSFDLFGDRMAVVHAKDFRIEDGRLVACPPGLGMLDYPFLFSRIAGHKPGIAVLLEEVPVAQVAACGRFILDQIFSPIS